jgi:DNA-binding NarL/FixJ family response regulator
MARLFTSPRGGRIITAVLRDATHWDEVVTGLGYEHLRRHDLRHTGLNWMADVGVPVHVLRKIAGHGSLVTTQHYLVREGTRRLLEDSGEVEVLAGVGTGDELLTAVGQLKPNAVLTDIRMPPGHQTEGIEAAHAIRRDHPQAGVVILSQYSDASYAVQLFGNGTDGLGYLLKASIGELDDLLHALREVTAGRSLVDARVVELLVEQRIRQAESPLGRLVPHELQVLTEMAEGKTNAAIGESLQLSESAIEKYVNAIFTKPGLSEERKISRRVGAVLVYLRDLDRRT